MRGIARIAEFVAAPHLRRLGFPKLLDVPSFSVVAQLAHRPQLIERRVRSTASFDRQHMVNHCRRHYGALF